MAISFDGWQQGAAQLILGCDGNGRYVSTIGGVTISIPRQVGKTFTIGSLLVAMCLEFPGLRVVWTSHHLRTTTNTFRAMQRMVNRPRVAGKVAHIRLANGEQEISFTNTSIIMFGARERGFGVGIDAIDVLVCDEAQRLRSTALADMLPTTNQAKHIHGALTFFIGTPPRPENDGDEFLARRTKALEGRLTNGIYIEMSADDNGDLNDPKQWERANPSYPHRTPHEAMLRLRENLNNEGDWRREAMGVWDKTSSGSRFISAADWTATEVTGAPTEGVRAFGVAFSIDGSRVSLAGALRHESGVYVEPIEALSGATEAGVALMSAWLAERWRTVAEIHIAGPDAKVMYDALREAGVPERVVKAVTTPDYFAACSSLVDGIRDRTLTHPKADETDVLNASVAVCDRKVRATGLWGWEATTEDGDETPIEAASLAYRAAKTTKRRPGRQMRGRVL